MILLGIRPGLGLTPAVAMLSLLVSCLPAAAQTAAEDSWAVEQGQRDVSRVNEGQLKFIAPIDDRPVLHADTRLGIKTSSLQTGWIELQQCYRNLDAVDRTDIVYAYREMRDLQVTQSENINNVSTRPAAVELEGVGQGASVCLQAEVRILRRLSQASYALHQGPYHRRFLDGYYPYHLSLTISYPREAVRLTRLQPQARLGFEVRETSGELVIESWFEGELSIEMEFAER